MITITKLCKSAKELTLYKVNNNFSTFDQAINDLLMGATK